MQFWRIDPKIKALILELAIVFILMAHNASVLADRSLSVPFFSQRDPKWADKFLDNSPFTIGGDGCALTSTAMVVCYYGVDTDPSRLNDALTPIGGIDRNGILHWEKVPDVCGGKVTWIGRVDLPDWNRINSEIDQGYPVIADVRIPSEEQHFIVIWGKAGSNYYFYDPYDYDEIDRTWPTGALGTYTLIGLRIYHGTPASGYASVSEGVTVTPLEVPVDDRYEVTFTLKETKGAPITFTDISVLIEDNNGNELVILNDHEYNRTIPANGTWTYNGHGYAVGVLSTPGLYKAFACGDVGNGRFKFSITGSGENPGEFQVSEKPDLAVQNPTISSSGPYYPGSSVSISCIIKNQGQGSAGPSRVKYYLSTSPTGTEYYFGAWDSVDSLSAGETSSESETFTIPSYIPCGNNYYVVFYADADDQVNESDENNNKNNAGPINVECLDTTAPPAPINLTATPSGWININSFSINWTNPSDSSGIAGAYYKLGSTPTSKTDGNYKTDKPFTVSATSQGGQVIYVWLKDGAGNADHHNRSSTMLYYDDTPPTGTITSPSANAYITTNSLTITANASDTGSGVSKVRFHLTCDSRGNNSSWQHEGIWYYLDDSSSPYSATWNLSGISDQDITIMIWVWDEAGNTVQEPGGRRTVTVDRTTPTIISKIPPSNKTNVSVATNIQVTFSEPMNQSATESAFSITPSVNGPKTCTSNTLIFNPSANLEYSTTYTVSISSQATDLAGNPLSPTSWSFSTEPPSNTPPTISGLPDKNLNEDNTLNNAIDLWAYASDAETVDSGLTFTITGNTNSNCGVSIDDSNRYIDINPTANWYGYSDVTVEVTDPEGLSDPDTFRITVNPINDPPTILSTIPNQSADKNTLITIDLTPYESDVEDSGTSLDWYVQGEDFCTVSGEYSDNDVLTFTSDNNFVGDDFVTLYLLDSGGLTDNQQIKLTWLEVYKADFTWSPESPKEGQEIQFTDQSTPQEGIASWLWDFGDGGTSSEQNPEYMFQQASNPSQTFNVSLIVQWTIDNDTATKSIVVSDKDPIADFTFSLETSVAGQEVQFTDQSLSYDGITSFWEFGDGETSSEQNPQHTYTQANTYTVSLTVTEADGDTNTAHKDITVYHRYGDVTGDGTISGFDALLILMHTVGSLTLTENEQKAADVDGDGEIKAIDASLVMQYSIGKIIEFPVESGQPPAIADISPNEIKLTLPKITVKPNMPIVLPIKIKQVENIVFSCELTLDYDASLLNLLQVLPGSTTDDLLLEYSKKDNQIRISLASAAPIQKGGVLVQVEFTPVTQPVITPVSLSRIQLNGQLIPEVFESVIEVLPKKSALLQNFPNPFNPETWIPYQLAKEAEVVIDIYNIKGQLVRTLSVGPKPAGSYISKEKSAFWNGQNNIGESAASGLYFYRLKAGDFQAVRKMIIVK